jgi:hypothetical protein
MPRSKRDETSEDLTGVVADLRRVVSRLERTVAKLTRQLDERDERIAELEKALGESRRSAKRQAAPFRKPKSDDEPATPGRKAGDAHGHHGHRAAPAGPPDRELVAPLPGCCPDCGGLVDHERDEQQWQVDLPEARAMVTRFAVGVGRCRDCGRRVQGRHPEQSSDALGAAASQVGPVAKGWAAWLHYGLGLSFAKCARLLARLGIDVTAGALCSAAQRAGTDLVPVHAQIVRRLNEAEMVVADETGWRVEGDGAWLWVATTTDATAYNVAKGRGFDAATEVIDEDYDGVLVRDGWAPTAATPTPPTKAVPLTSSGEQESWWPTCRLGLGARPARSATSWVRPWRPGISTRPGGQRPSRTWPSASSCWASNLSLTTSAESSSPTCSTSARRCSPSSPAPMWTPPTGGPSRPSAPPWSTARSGVETAPGGAPPPRAGS